MQLNSVETCGKSKKKWHFFNFVARYVDGVIEICKIKRFHKKFAWEHLYQHSRISQKSEINKDIMMTIQGIPCFLSILLVDLVEFK